MFRSPHAHVTLAASACVVAACRPGGTSRRPASGMRASWRGATPSAAQLGSELDRQLMPSARPIERPTSDRVDCESIQLSILLFYVCCFCAVSLLPWSLCQSDSVEISLNSLPRSNSLFGPRGAWSVAIITNGHWFSRLRLISIWQVDEELLEGREDIHARKFSISDRVLEIEISFVLSQSRSDSKYRRVRTSQEGMGNI
jgi:hypothetical protein